MTTAIEEKRVNVENAIRAFYQLLDQRAVPILEFCPKAGYCAKDCHFYIITERDDLVPGKKGIRIKKFYKTQYSIVGKLFGKLAGAIELTEDELQYWVELAYKYCSYCDRCSISCPYSLLNPPLTYLMRAMIHAAGLTPPSLQSMLKNEMEIGHPMGVTKEQWLNFINTFSEKYDINVPMDVKGADILYLPGYRSILDDPEAITSAFKIFDALGVNWTVSSELYTASLFPFEIAAIDELTELVTKRTRLIEDMSVKKVIIGSDGQGFYAWRWESGRYLNRRPKFEIYHIVEFLAEMLKRDKLKLKRIDDNSIYTYQDPCNLARRSGIEKEPRKIIHEIITNYKEMPQHGVYSYCCSAGCFEVKEYWDTRMDAFRVKLEQIQKTNAEKIITLCDMCYVTIKEGFRRYNYKGEVIDLTKLIGDSIE